MVPNLQSHAASMLPQYQESINMETAIDRILPMDTPDALQLSSARAWSPQG